MARARSHHEELQRLLETLDQPVGAVAWHYVRAVLDECDGCIAEASRRLGMHRRTVQRMLQKSKPKPRCET